MGDIYELTITPNYVLDWKFEDAMRELIQNGVDAQTLDDKNKFGIEYDFSSSEVTLSNAKSALDIQTMLLGKTSKDGDKNTVGQFGEGYKIAALVLNRLGKTLTIYNNRRNEIWHSKFIESEKWGSKILAFEVEKKRTKEKDLKIVIGNVERYEYNNLALVWLGFEEEDGYKKSVTSYGDILLDDRHRGRIFVNGLSVQTNAELKYGYNFKPCYINLERDRKSADSWNVVTITGNMVTESLAKGDITIEDVHSLTNGSSYEDVRYLEFTTYRDDTKAFVEQLYQKIVSENPGCIPVSSQEQFNLVRSYGGKPVIVNEKTAKLLKDKTEALIRELSMQDFGGVLTVKDRFARWLAINSKRLSKEAIDDFNKIMEDL